MDQRQQQASKTNAQEVRRQNAASAQGNSFDTEFASETNVEEVRQQNAQSEARKARNSSNFNQQ